MRKKYCYNMMILLLLCCPKAIFTQNELSDSTCKEKFSLFYTQVNGKSKSIDYRAAFDAWLICFQDCPNYSRHLYSYGNHIVNNLYYNHPIEQRQKLDSISDQIFKDWMAYYPEESDKIYDRWASSLLLRKKSKERIYEKLDSTYKWNPLSMTTKNRDFYFNARLDKDDDLLNNYNFYLEFLKLIDGKIDSLSRQLDSYKQKEVQSKELSHKDIQKKNTLITTLKGLGKTAMDMTIQINKKYPLDCETLTRLYSAKFDQHKTNKQWLNNAITQLFNKDCKTAIVEKLIEAEIALNAVSPEALIFLERSSFNKPFSQSQLKKLIDLTYDPYQKAELYYKIGQGHRNNPSVSASYAKRALTHQPTMGKAYLMIAVAYAKSANACGTDEFSKRMVFVAAADKAKRAKEVDPSVSHLASRYIQSYKNSFPTKRLGASVEGNPYKIGCWINETVKIP